MDRLILQMDRLIKKVDRLSFKADKLIVKKGNRASTWFPFSFLFLIDIPF
jgi:hypothetical protein